MLMVMSGDLICPGRGVRDGWRGKALGVERLALRVKSLALGKERAKI